MPAKRYSRQRELILHALRSTREHPTAEMLYQSLKPDNPNLSLGTVYRNLNLLSAEGAIVRMSFPVERFDADVSPHPHFSCRCCGRVYDLELPYDPELDRRVSQLGHQVSGHDLVFTGVCAQCVQTRGTSDETST